MTMFGVAALLGPIVGPTLGGWLVVNYDWRWIFYINLPVGVLGFLACYVLLDDPAYLKEERAKLKKRPLNFDDIGLGLLALVMATWEVMLSKGQEWDWLGDPFWRVQTLLILFVLGAGRPALPRDADSPARSSTSACSASATSRPVASSSSPRSPCLYAATRGLAGLAPDVVRLRRLMSRAWCCRRPASSRS